MFDTKIALVLRSDLLPWQALNVTAFLMSGIVAGSPDLIGERYQDAAGHSYSPLCRQPVIVLAADRATLTTIHARALARGVEAALYVEAMFSTGHDEANRAAMRAVRPEDGHAVGLGLRAERRLVDKITKGARMHG